MSQTVNMASSRASGDAAPQLVSSEDREAFDRQVSALATAESTDEGTADSRARRIADADADRARLGIPPLKTEPELHRLARDLGLLRR
ncbi:MAG TPA: hypothetical protein VNF71_14865 [Acidimicrobiales bacterium]|nr:hypothetical protein [Acidimicrobiales bacterium]